MAPREFRHALDDMGAAIDGTMPSQTMKISKLEVARRQLVTSIQLFFQDWDSVSIHTLAHASWEILDALCKHRSENRFRLEMATANNMTEYDIKKIACHGRNFFKHADRDPEELLEGFSDVDNDHIIFAAAIDYGQLANSKPIEIHVFEIWYFAVYADNISQPECDAIRCDAIRLFPEIGSTNRKEQKVAGRKVLERAIGDPDLMEDPSTDRSGTRAL